MSELESWFDALQNSLASWERGDFAPTPGPMPPGRSDLPGRLGFLMTAWDRQGMDRHAHERDPVSARVQAVASAPWREEKQRQQAMAMADSCVRAVQNEISTLVRAGMRHASCLATDDYPPEACFIVPMSGTLGTTVHLAAVRADLVPDVAAELQAPGFYQAPSGHSVLLLGYPSRSIDQTQWVPKLWYARTSAVRITRIQTQLVLDEQRRQDGKREEEERVRQQLAENKRPQVERELTALRADVAALQRQVAQLRGLAARSNVQAGAA